mgnify:FL=1|jgi:hypothetical protein|tara:strand:- start:450 stop:692 length:243 start_codon:yes stop_codon:yes gene_type:complete
MFSIHHIDSNNADINNLTAIVYNSIHDLLVRDKLDPVQLAIALTCASRMLLKDFVNSKDVPAFLEYANNLLIDHEKVTKH